MVYLVEIKNFQFQELGPLIAFYGICVLKLLPAFQKIFHSYAVIKSHASAFESIEQDLIEAKMALGQARGALILAAAQANLPVSEYAPRKVKMSVCGNGAASKEQVGYMVLKTLKLKSLPKSHDISDAIAVGICFFNQAKFL